MVPQLVGMGSFAQGASTLVVTTANTAGMPSSPACLCRSEMGPELPEMLRVLPTISPGAGMGVLGGARLLGFFRDIPGGVGPPLLHPWGLVPSQGKDTMTGTISEPRGAAVPGEGGDAVTWLGAGGDP